MQMSIFGLAPALTEGPFDGSSISTEGSLISASAVPFTAGFSPCEQAYATLELIFANKCTH